jgi:L-alanine-DL-glutamate epimerase-like enolase superfamily enzyme
MNRRSFVASLGPLALGPALGAPKAVRSAGRMKVTEVRNVRLKLVKDLGTLEPAWTPGYTLDFRVGGGAFLEVRTDQGLVGIGPAVDPTLVPLVQKALVGKDPFDTEQHSAFLSYEGAGERYDGAANVDIALWDLVGKACGQPIYKLLGGGRDKVGTYAAMIKLSTPEERADKAAELADQGWKAIKLRLHFPTMKEDVAVVEAVRARIGDRMQIMTDANQAENPGRWQPGPLWDFRRALETARELERLKCAWLEEPLPRFTFEQHAELRSKVSIPIAGGENNFYVHEFHWMLQKGVFDIIQPEVMLAGGFTGLRKIGVLAEIFDRQLTPHVAIGDIGSIAALHLVASWRRGNMLELDHDPPIGDYRKRFAIFRNPPAVDSEGNITVPQGPGLGVDIDPDLILA